MKETKKEKRYN